MSALCQKRKFVVRYQISDLRHFLQCDATLI
jgi:hypothetical protein